MIATTRDDTLAWSCVALCCAAIAWRTPGGAAVAVTAAAGVVGLLLPATTQKTTRWFQVIVLGSVAFLCARLLAGNLFAPPATAYAAIATSVAAVAEEALFRRAVYGGLARFGPLAAIAGSALLFAAVHVPAYGVAVFPLDLAAGVVLSWQRWAAGTWTAPAATHVLANLLQLR